MIESIVFCDRKINLIVKKIEALPSIFALQSFFDPVDLKRRLKSEDRRSFDINSKTNCQKHTKKYVFSERIALFLERFNLFDLFQRSARAIRYFFYLFQRSTRAIRSLWSFQRSTRVIWFFFKDRRERFGYSRYFLKIIKIERSKIKRSNSQPWKFMRQAHRTDVVDELFTH